MVLNVSSLSQSKDFELPVFLTIESLRSQFLVTLLPFRKFTTMLSPPTTLSSTGVLVHDFA